MKVNFTMLCLTVITLACIIFAREQVENIVLLWILYGGWRVLTWSG